MNYYQIWIEGYAATGEHGTAFLLNNGSEGKPGLIAAESFDEAVKIYMKEVKDHGIKPNLESQYRTKEYFDNRRSNWNIWACNLYDNELEARVSFG